MGNALRFGVVCIAVVACGGKKDEVSKNKDQDRDVPIRIAFSDCRSSPVPFVSGPRPLPPQLDEGEATASADPAAPPSKSAGAFVSLTASGDIATGFDDTDIYGGLLG